MGLGGRGIRDHGTLDNKGVRKVAAGNNRGICSRDINILTLYRRIADGGFQ